MTAYLAPQRICKKLCFFPSLVNSGAPAQKSGYKVTRPRRYPEIMPLKPFSPFPSLISPVVVTKPFFSGQMPQNSQFCLHPVEFSGNIRIEVWLGGKA
jgi:hypothetical protein